MESSSLSEILEEYAELEQQLADPSVHADPERARKLGRRYSELAPIAEAAKELDEVRADLATATELATEDEAFAEEVEELSSRIPRLESRLTELLLPQDPYDSSDIVMEIKSGAGGEESALFAGDLLRMYLRYAERQNWKAETLGVTYSDLGGYKDVTLSVKTRDNNAEGVWAQLKFEGGVHRVQRVPTTETQGRIHTSAAGVFIYPEPEEIEVEVDPNDVRMDVFRSSGPGGQSVNTTDSAVRLTHLPTGVVVSCQNEKSQIQNRTRAMQVLQARLQAMAEEEAAAKAADTRRSQVRTVDRSERVRTYNFPENRISDHRIKYKAYNLDQVLDGSLDDVLTKLRVAEREERVARAEA